MPRRKKAKGNNPQQDAVALASRKKKNLQICTKCQVENAAF